MALSIIVRIHNNVVVCVRTDVPRITDVLCFNTGATLGLVTDAATINLRNTVFY